MNDKPIIPVRPIHPVRKIGEIEIRRRPSFGQLWQWLAFVQRRNKGKATKDPDQSTDDNLF